jgi:hypothetical protein
MYFVLVSSKKTSGLMPANFYEKVYQHLENSFINGSLISIRFTKDGRHTVSIVKANSPEELLFGLKSYPYASLFRWRKSVFHIVGDIHHIDVDAQWEKLRHRPWNIQTDATDLMGAMESIINTQKTMQL